MTDWIDADAAAQRLGIKRATLYAYVSRGVLVRRRSPDGRGSLFDAAEIERLARRGRPRRAPGTTELVIESALTEITGDRLSFRGHEATALAATHSLEDIATLLWTGVLRPAGAQSASQKSAAQNGATAAPWRANAAAVAVGSAAQAALPGHALPLERLQVIVPALAAADPLRLHLDAPAVMAAGRTLIAGLVDSLPAPPATHQASPAHTRGGITERLWPKLCPEPATPGLLAALRAALVLLADHELAASTFAARVAASVRADPYAVVATGLGALGGPLHGGASLGAEGMLAGAASPADAPRVVGDLLRLTGRVPGFGHFVYRAGDPRAVCLLALVRRGAPGSPRLAVADAVLAEMRDRALPEPNIDLALAVLADVAGLISGAGEAIFAVARTAGWIAHALEEYARATPLRPRAVYTGPPAPLRGARCLHRPARPVTGIEAASAGISLTGFPRGEFPARGVSSTRRGLPCLFAGSTTRCSTSATWPGPPLSTSRCSASRCTPKYPGGPPSCAPPAQRTTMTWACSRWASPAPRPSRRSASTTWPGRWARSANWPRSGTGWPPGARWSAPATTGCRSRCTPRTRTASSSRLCGASRPRTGRVNWPRAT